ncbi:unnamed protein product, partial [Closterium sp. Naga37s-1]
WEQGERWRVEQQQQQSGTHQCIQRHSSQHQHQHHQQQQQRYQHQQHEHEQQQQQQRGWQQGRRGGAVV